MELSSQSCMVEVWVNSFLRISLPSQNFPGYIKSNQKEMCAEVYSGAKNVMTKSDGDEKLKNVEKRIILPLSFIGGD